MSKITDFTVLATPQSDDVLVIVDVHDTTMAPTGTDKKISVQSLLNNLANLANLATSRTNLGLGSAATQSSGAFVSKSGDTMAGTLAPNVVALTDATTILVAAGAGNRQRVTLGGNRTMGAPSSPVDGDTITFELVQDASGSRTVTWTSGAGGYSFGSGVAPTLSTAAHAVDLVAFSYSSVADAGAGAWCYLGFGSGF